MLQMCKCFSVWMPNWTNHVYQIRRFMANVQLRYQLSPEEFRYALFWPTRLCYRNIEICILIFAIYSDASIVCMFQRLLAWTRNWKSHQLMTSLSVKIQSFHSGERFLPMSKVSFVRSSMRSYVFLAYRLDWLWWYVPTASLSTSSLCPCWLSRVCEIYGEVDNSETLSSHSSLSSQAILEQSG